MKRSYIAILLAIALTVGAAAPATAQADDDGGILGGVVGEEGEDDPFWVDILDSMIGVSSSVQKYADSAQMSIFGDGGENATQYANAVDDTLEANNDSIRAYANERVTPVDLETVEVYFHDRDGNNVTRYLVADASADGWTSGPSLLTPAEFNATNRTSAHWLSLDWYASRHADGELTAFVEDRVDPGENVSQLRKANLLRKYGGSIKSSLWDDALPSFGGEN